MNHIAASAPPRQQTGLAILMGQDHRTLVSEHGALNRHHLSSLDTNGKMGRIECVPLQPEAGASITCRCSGPCAWVSASTFSWRHGVCGPEIGRASCRERVCQYV